MNRPETPSALENNAPESLTSRRRFLSQLACGALMAIASPGIVPAAVRHVYGGTGHKALSLENIHTGEKLNLTYFERGRYFQDALVEVNHFFRDYRTGDVHPMDPSLLDILHDLKGRLAVAKPIKILSGYRSPRTNASLRRRRRGVAKHSMHMEGRAIDIRISGVDVRHIRNAAIALGRGGVGYYPRSNFIHLDTGDFRTW